MKRKFNLIDTYRQIGTLPGYTEDTTLNYMRWNQKLIEKHYRYDAILASGLKIISSKIIGKEYEYLSEEDSKWFLENISEAKSIKEFHDEMKENGYNYDDEEDGYQSNFEH